MLKDKFLEDKKCLICGKTFEQGSDESKYRLFLNHVKKEHNISYEDYYLKYYLNNNIVYCACGCGQRTKYHKGEFFKYYADHKNKTKMSDETYYKIRKSKEKINGINYLMNRTEITYDILEKGYKEYINLEKPMSVLSNELGIDFRTLKSYWIKNNLIKDLDAFKRISKRSQLKWMVNPIQPNSNIINILKENLILVKEELSKKNKMTFDEIINIVGVKINKNYLSYFLKEHLTSDEVKKIKFIKNSQIEMNFLNVLKFYFKNVVHSFELEGKFFDYKIGNILIELDGEYWHSKEKTQLNDKLKDKIAKNNNFILIRVSDKNVTSINFLNKIQKIYEEIK